VYKLIHMYVYTCKFLTSDNPAEKLTNKNYVGQTAHKQTLSQRCMERGRGAIESAPNCLHTTFFTRRHCVVTLSFALPFVLPCGFRCCTVETP